MLKSGFGRGVTGGLLIGTLQASSNVTSPKNLLLCFRLKRDLVEPALDSSSNQCQVAKTAKQSRVDSMAESGQGISTTEESE